MLTVIADDFTGAAEIAGIGLRYGLITTLVTTTDQNKDKDYDLMVIATNMRAMEDTAIKELLAQLLQDVSDSEMIFIKLDSVLRGPVKVILQNAMTILAKDRTLFVPANPALGRTIEKGIYFIHGLKLNPSDFFADAKVQNLNAEVISLIRKKEFETIYSVTLQDILSPGISIADVSTESEMMSWTKRLETNMLAAGGSSFFKAIVAAKNKRERLLKELYKLGKKRLFVCGSYHPYSKKAIKNAVLNGTKLRLISKNMLDNTISSEDLKDWISAICQDLKIHGTVILAVANLEGFYMDRLSQRIEYCFSELVFRIMKKVAVDELIIEGGATSFAVMKKLGYHQFEPRLELAPGLIRMTPLENENLNITVKPGSYTWPDSIWINHKTNNQTYG